MSKTYRLEIEYSDLKKLSVRELAALCDGIREVRDLAVALSNQPKFNVSSDAVPGVRDYSDAGEALEKIIGFLDGYETLLIKRLRKAPCDDRHDVDRKYERLLRFYSGEGLTYLNGLLAEGLAEQRRVSK